MRCGFGADDRVGCRVWVPKGSLAAASVEQNWPIVIIF
jgi:hypothetical protein